MLMFKKGNMLNEEADVLVNAVNCVGVMGRGLALQFREAYPDNFDYYSEACRFGVMQIGRMFIFDTGLTKPRYIVNFPTKRHWRNSSRIEDINYGLQALVKDVKRMEIQSIALPALGCGFGGLDFSRVKPLIEFAASILPTVEMTVFLPGSV